MDFKSRKNKLYGKMRFSLLKPSKSICTTLKLTQVVIFLHSRSMQGNNLCHRFSFFVSSSYSHSLFYSLSPWSQNIRQIWLISRVLLKPLHVLDEPANIRTSTCDTCWHVPVYIYSMVLCPAWRMSAVIIQKTTHNMYLARTCVLCYVGDWTT